MAENITTESVKGNAEWHPAVQKQIYTEGDNKGRLTHEADSSDMRERQITEDAAGLEASLRALGKTQGEIDAEVNTYIEGRMESSIRSGSKELTWEQERTDGTRMTGGEFWKSVDSNNDLASEQVDELLK